jgi:hypothetical protein
MRDLKAALSDTKTLPEIPQMLPSTRMSPHIEINKLLFFPFSHQKAYLMLGSQERDLKNTAVNICNFF